MKPQVKKLVKLLAKRIVGEIFAKKTGLDQLTFAQKLMTPVKYITIAVNGENAILTVEPAKMDMIDDQPKAKILERAGFNLTNLVASLTKSGFKAVNPSSTEPTIYVLDVAKADLIGLLSTLFTDHQPAITTSPDKIWTLLDLLSQGHELITVYLSKGKVHQQPKAGRIAAIAATIKGEVSGFLIADQHGVQMIYETVDGSFGQIKTIYAIGEEMDVLVPLVINVENPGYVLQATAESETVVLTSSLHQIMLPETVGIVVDPNRQSDISFLTMTSSVDVQDSLAAE